MMMEIPKEKFNVNSFCSFLSHPSNKWYGSKFLDKNRFMMELLIFMLFEYIMVFFALL